MSFEATGCAIGLVHLEGIRGCLHLKVWKEALVVCSKDAFAGTYIDEVCTTLMNLYYLYQNSPKRLRELKQIAEIMDEQVLKPEKVHGTRWLQHKMNACHALITSYPAIITHLESLAATGKTAEQAKLKGYLKKLKSLNFVTHLIFFQELLKPLAKISQCLQGERVDLLMALSMSHSMSSGPEQCGRPSQILMKFGTVVGLLTL